MNAFPARTNSYPGTCHRCHDRVEAGKGTLRRGPGSGWQIQCGRCNAAIAEATAALPAAKPRVTVALQGGSLVVKPADRLGDAFTGFKAACDAAAGRWSRDTGETRVPLAKGPALVQALAALPIALDVATDAKGAIEGAAVAIQTDVAQAQVRAGEVDAILAARGGALFPFQREGVAWLAPRHSALLADDMGLGKTIQVLVSIPEGAPVVVVCPAVAKGVWRSETAKWRPDIRVTVLSGRGSFRWPAPGEMVIVNYDILPGTTTKKGSKVELDAGSIPDGPEGCVVVADEAHALKSRSAARTARFQGLSKIARAKGGRAWLLTATPLLNDPGELWGVLSAADLCREAFGSWPRFVQMFGGRDTRWGLEWGTPDTASVVDALRRVSLRRRKTEVLHDMPAKSHRRLTVEVSLSKADKVLVKQAEAALDAGDEDLARDIRNDSDEVNSSPGFRRISAVRRMLAERKIPAMLDLIEEYEAQGEPVVVFSAHRAPIDGLGTREGWAIITGDTSPERRAEIQEAMQAGKLRGVACTIKAGGVAITLTRASHAIFVDQEWTPALNSQAEDRIYRIGQTRPVTITLLVAEVPVDERIADLLDQKAALVAGSTDAASRTSVESEDVSFSVSWDELDADVEAAHAAAARQAVEDGVGGGAGASGSRGGPYAPETDEERTLRMRRGRMARRLEATQDSPRYMPRDDQESFLASALHQLADLDDDRACVENGVGYSKATSSPGHCLSMLIRAGHGLTEDEWKDAAKIARIHRGQVGVWKVAS